MLEAATPPSINSAASARLKIFCNKSLNFGGAEDTSAPSAGACAVILPSSLGETFGMRKCRTLSSPGSAKVAFGGDPGIARRKRNPFFRSNDLIDAMTDHL